MHCNSNNCFSSYRYYSLMMLLDTAKRLKNFVSQEFFINSRSTLGQDIYTILFQDESTK